MRIGIYDPYLDTLGGGERYILSAASCLSKNHQVEIFWSDSQLLTQASQKLHIDLSKVKITPNIFLKDSTISRRLLETSRYDRIIFLSDGSLPWLFAKKNIILFQFPVNWVKGGSIANKLKLRRVHKIICYTKYVKHYLDNTFHTNSKVLYPPVESLGFSDKKENIILTVGRYTKGMNMKKQEVLIDAFKQMHKKVLIGWRFVLIGSYLPGDKDFVEHLKKTARGYPIEIITGASFEELSDYYKKAKIYWHAAGYGEDLEKHPERAEHFGISTVEAMGAGAVPVVINAGGQKEIITNDENGFLWNTLTELEDYTKNLADDKQLWTKLSEKALARASEFSLEKFCTNINNLIAE